LSHSHTAVQFFIQKAETLAHRRALRKARPPWTVRLAEQVADAFQPLSGVARVGYEIELGDDDRWIITLFLGQTETVGGPEDGSRHLVNFQFDLASLIAGIDRVDELAWFARPEPESEHTVAGSSYLELKGQTEREPVTVRIASVPPTDAALGIRVHENGVCELPE